MQNGANSLREEFAISVILREECAVFQWLCNVYIDGMLKEMKVALHSCVIMILNERNGTWWLFADDAAVVGESKEQVQKDVEVYVTGLTKGKENRN